MQAVAKPSIPPILDVDKSTVLRDRLLNEIAALTSLDATTTWAREALATKNKLTAEHAKLLEEGFEQKIAELMQSESGEALGIQASTASVCGNQENTTKEQPDTERADKSLLTLSEPRRYRNKEHLRFIVRQPCLLCARKPSDAHHLRFVQPRALGRKASDEFAVPLCRTHHRAVHRSGDEQSWWKASGIDPIKVARKLWKETLTSKPGNPVAAVMHDAQQTPKADPAGEKAS